MATKKPIQSKNLWFNTLTIISMVGATLLADDNFRELIGGSELLIVVGVAVINMVIRMYTTKPISREEPVKPDSEKSPLDIIDDELKKDSMDMF